MMSTPPTLIFLLQARAADYREARLRGASGEPPWRAQMLPYQVRIVEAHDEQVRESMRLLYQAEP